jgi:EAL domain-containing protein (putative c-di-GMP-specific phosphodiesterase class I)
MTVLPAGTGSGVAIDGVRLLSHRPSVLYKIEPLADAAASGGDIGVEGLALTGPDWDERLKRILGSLTHSERACLYAVPLDDDDRLPLPAEVLVRRARTDWFPEFLSHGLMVPHFQPIVDLSDGHAFGREALMRGRLGAVEVRGGELLAAAQAHDALYSFDARARSAALEVGLPLLPAGEVLFVNVDPRAVLDIASSMRTTWPIVERMGGDPTRLCLELVKPERTPDLGLVVELAGEHRRRGALVALDDLSGGTDALRAMEAVLPDLVKIDMEMTSGIHQSAARRRLVGALVDCAHEQGAKVVAEGIERRGEFATMRELGVDYGQGFYFGQPVERPVPVDERLVLRPPELV